MSIDLNTTYSDLKELEKLIDRFAYPEKHDSNIINIHIEELRSWLLRVEHIRYPIEAELGIDDDNNLECPLCSDADKI